ncbi:MAG: hypothetical protein NZ765_05620 [Anaerolineae bacterium]|nr:hypothetical protein [Anaerolineae bacterium]MDW8071969.1 hypothetical protein [Anaerolineae bacterium]
MTEFLPKPFRIMAARWQKRDQVRELRIVYPTPYLCHFTARFVWM